MLASIADVEQAWRPLSVDESARVAALIARASRKIRRRWPDVDDRIASGDLSAEVVADVVAEMVQSAMAVPASGVEQHSQAAGPFNQSTRYANPLGRLFFTSEMVAVFETKRRSHTAWLA